MPGTRRTPPAPSGEAPQREVRLGVGEVAVSHRPATLVTLLGSCVSVCLYDPQASSGGMNHILLPGRADLKRFDDTARYGINAMELLINRLLKEGKAERGRLRAKVFGGAAVLDVIAPQSAPGARNCEFTLEFLRLEGIPVVGQDLGGVLPRRVFFYPHTGEVWVQKVSRPVLAQGLKREEQDYLHRIEREKGGAGSVELFPPGTPKK